MKRFMVMAVLVFGVRAEAQDVPTESHLISVRVESQVVCSEGRANRKTVANDLLRWTYSERSAFSARLISWRDVAGAKDLVLITEKLDPQTNSATLAGQIEVRIDGRYITMTYVLKAHIGDDGMFERGTMETRSTNDCTIVRTITTR